MAISRGQAFVRDSQTQKTNAIQAYMIAIVQNLKRLAADAWAIGKLQMSVAYNSPLSGQRLTHERCGVADGEDVAISVMESFFRAAKNGRFPDLNDRDGIWRLLSTMTRRKVIDLIRKN